MEHARISRDLEMPSHQAANGSFGNGGHVELTELNVSSRDWSTESDMDEHRERPSNEKLLVSYLFIWVCHK